MAKKVKKKEIKAVYEIIITIAIIVLAIISWHNNKEETVDAITEIKTITAEETQNIELVRR